MNKEKEKHTDAKSIQKQGSLYNSYNNNNNSILNYLLGDLTAERPTTMLARVRRMKQQNRMQNKAGYKVVSVIVITHYKSKL
jgi:hypothetical protein